jgi:hypothetical protein
MWAAADEELWMLRPVCALMQRSEHEVRRIGDLEIDEDFAFQKRSWRVQRIGQFLVALFVLAGLAGLLGGGGFARTTARSGGTEVEYPRFLRAHMPVEFRIAISSTSADEPLFIGLDAAFFESFQVEKISPEPRLESLGGGRVGYEFARFDAGLTPIVLRAKAKRIGATAAYITVGNTVPTKLETFVFP